MKLVLLVAVLASAVMMFEFGMTKQKPIKNVTEVIGNLTITPAPVPNMYTNEAVFMTAIKKDQSESYTGKVTGITIPHHLLAANIIAKAFKFAAEQNPSQIIILSPDHFDLGKTNISTTNRDFMTIGGILFTDKMAVNELLNDKTVSENDFFYREHGIQAMLPFIKYFFPNSKIVVLTIKVSTPKKDLEMLLESLEKAIKPDSLIVQSTDFSHYLDKASANKMDRDTIKKLTEEKAENIWQLKQPENMDSLASQYIQMRLQEDIFKNKMVILEHGNSQDYTSKKLDSTTSYIAQAYVQSEARLVFVGDMMLDRGVKEKIDAGHNNGLPFAELGGLLKTSDVNFANLESPVSDKGADTGKNFSFRVSPQMLKIVKDVGFGILSVANNHMWDWGKQAFEDTLINLDINGIKQVGAGNSSEIINVNGTKIAFLGFTDLLPRSLKQINYLDPEKVKMDIQQVKQKADIVAVSLHWGQEYQSTPSARQVQLAHEMVDAGADLIIGHHPHTPQPIERYKEGIIIYSLGNFIFDQNFSPETRFGLAVRINLLNKKIVWTEQLKLGFTRQYQPFVE